MQFFGKFFFCPKTFFAARHSKEEGQLVFFVIPFIL